MKGIGSDEGKCALSQCNAFSLAVCRYITGLPAIPILTMFILFPAEVDANAVCPPSVDARAPDFTVAAPDDNLVSLSDYRGRVALISFWSTWCGNCKIEMPWLAQLRESTKPKDSRFWVL